MKKMLMVKCPNCGIKIKRDIFVRMNQWRKPESVDGILDKSRRLTGYIDLNTHHVSEKARKARVVNGKGNGLLSGRDMWIISTHKWTHRMSLRSKASYLYTNRAMLGITGNNDEKPVTERAILRYLSSTNIKKARKHWGI